jgi:hypothetical protein
MPAADATLDTAVVYHPYLEWERRPEEELRSMRRLFTYSRRIERSLSYERSFEVSGVPLVIHLYKVRKLSSASRFLEEKLRSARERGKQSED